MAAVALASSGGCARDSYAGVDLRSGAAPVDIQALARQARSGDQSAQLALGDRYERGEGLVRDRARALALYRLAARESGGPLQLYQPGPRPGDAGRIVVVDRGPVRPGLREARQRLAMLAAAGAHR